MIRNKKADHMLDDDRQLAKYIAIVVRNAMEDFHVRHLSDAQMKELNPIIRNAVFTALYTARRLDDSAAARDFLGFHCRSIPSYWEEPELLADYHVMIKRSGESLGKDS